MRQRSRIPFLLRSEYGDIGWLGRLLLREGHDVTLHTQDPGAARVLENIVPRARSRQPIKRSVVIFDTAGHGAEGELLRAQGHLVIGGNRIDRDLELKRGKAMRMFERLGIAIPETHYFRSMPEGIAWLRKQPEEQTFFFKADGNLSAALTHGDKAPDLIRFMEWARHEPSLRRELGDFIIQREVAGDHCAELSTEGFFHYRRGWVLPFNGTLEEKPFLARGLGPRTGGEASVVWTYREAEPEPARQMLLPWTELLTEHRCVLPFDVNAIANRQGKLHGLETSPRPGIPAFQNLIALFEPGTIGEQLEAFAAGDLERFEVRSDAMALALKVSIPPYPTENAGEARKKLGFPLDDLLLDRPDRIFLDDVMAQDGRPVCAGSTGAIAVLVAVGDDLDQLREEVLEEADALDIKDKQYRPDPLEHKSACAEMRWSKLKAARVIPDVPPFGAPARPRPEEGDDENDDVSGDQEDAGDELGVPTVDESS